MRRFTTDTSRHAWLIDLDGTLYRSRPVKCCMAVELLFGGPTVWRTVNAFRSIHEELRQRTNESSRPQQSLFRKQIEGTASQLQKDPVTVEDTIIEWMFRRPGRWLRQFRRKDLIAAIQEHRAGGGVTALVSDYPARLKLEAMGTSSLFDHVIANGETDEPLRLKPAPDGLIEAAKRLKVDARDCLVIGDRDDADGRAAIEAGMAFQRIGK